MKTTNRKAMEYIDGKTVKVTKDNGIMVFFMVKE